MIRLLTAAALACLAGTVHAKPQPVDPVATALVINTSGFICTDITAMTPGTQSGTWNVRCVEFHDGTGRAHFAVDTQTGKVRKTD